MYTKIYADYSQYNQQTKMPVRSHYSLDHNSGMFYFIRNFFKTHRAHRENECNCTMGSDVLIKQAQPDCKIHKIV